jgi:membrane-bound ClpP family serine protease
MGNTSEIQFIQFGAISLFIIFIGLLIWGIFELKRAIRKGNLRRIQLSSGNAVDLQSERMFSIVDNIIGETGLTITDLNPQGVVYAKSDYWKATSNSPRSIQKNSKVIVLEMNGSDLIVKSLETQ